MLKIGAIRAPDTPASAAPMEKAMLPVRTGLIPVTKTTSRS
jgi:hypothetical protein